VFYYQQSLLDAVLSKQVQQATTGTQMGKFRSTQVER